MRQCEYKKRCDPEIDHHVKKHIYVKEYQIFSSQYSVKQ